MQFDVNKPQFAEALQRIIGVVERRHAIPILTNIHVQAHEHQIKLTATDMEIQLSAVASANVVQHEGQITVPGRKLFDIVKNLSDNGAMSVHLEKDMFIIESGNSRFSLKTLPANEYPTMEYGAATMEFSMPVEPLRHLIEQVSFAIANQDVRYYLNGLLLEISPHYFRSVATDGHRLSLSTLNTETGLSFNQCIIPRKSVLELSRILSSEEQPVQISLGEIFISAKGEKFFYVSKLIEGRYPNYSAVIPQDLSYSLALEKDMFKQALSRIMIFSSEKYHGVRFQLSDGALTIESRSSDQDEAKEVIPVNFSGGSLDVGFNATYFTDVISRLNEETLELMFSSSNQSAYIKQVNESFEDVYVVMPMLL